MTTVGKIMVFFVLLFSLVQGGLTVMLYMAQTRWASQYTQLAGKYEVSQKNALQFSVEAQNARTERDSRIAETKVAVKKLQEDYDNQRIELKNLQTNEQQWANDKIKANEVIAAAQADVKRSRDDADHLRSTLAKQTEANKELVNLNNSLRQEKVTAEIQTASYRDQNNRLMTKLDEMAKDLARGKVPAAGGATAKSGKNPPAESIEGLVRQTSPSGLVTITIGSDAGLLKGHTLEVFRLSSIPEQSKYLGTIKIIDVRATEAVGEPMGRIAPLQSGDHVASKILGS